MDPFTSPSPQDCGRLFYFPLSFFCSLSLMAVSILVQIPSFLTQPARLSMGDTL